MAAARGWTEQREATFFVHRVLVTGRTQRMHRNENGSNKMTSCYTVDIKSSKVFCDVGHVIKTETNEMKMGEGEGGG